MQGARHITTGAGAQASQPWSFTAKLEHNEEWPQQRAEPAWSPFLSWSEPDQTLEKPASGAHETWAVYANPEVRSPPDESSVAGRIHCRDRAWFPKRRWSDWMQVICAVALITLC